MATPERAARLLIVEDETHLAVNLRFNFEAEGYQVRVAQRLSEARAALSGAGVDLIVLDVMLPDGSGLDFLRELRRRNDRTPVLLLTARSASQHVVEGLELGADDYVCKPFSLEELIGRVGALLRRRRWDLVAEPGGGAGNAREEPGDSLLLGPHRVDFATHEAVLEGGERVELTELEIALLRYFAANENRVVSRGQLLEEVWGVSARTNTRTVDNFLVRLRRLFEEDPARPQRFLTVRGVGYRFVAAGR